MTASVGASVGVNVALFLSPLLFASAIIVAKMALNDGVDIHAFNAIRNAGAFVFTFFFRNRKCANKASVSFANCNPNFLYWSCICGLANALGMTCSAISLAHLNTAMFSFLLGLTVVITPLLAHFLPFKPHKLHWRGWCAVGISVIGTLVLEGCVENVGACFSGGNIFSIVALGAAFFYSLYAYMIDLGSNHVESSLLTQGTLFVSCIVLTIIALEPIALGRDARVFRFTHSEWNCVIGVAALEAVAWQCETFALVAVGPSKAAMAIATEAPMTTILAFIVLNESLRGMQYLGCALVFFAAAVAIYDGETVSNTAGADDGASASIANEDRQGLLDLNEDTIL